MNKVHKIPLNNHICLKCYFCMLVYVCFNKILVVNEYFGIFILKLLGTLFFNILYYLILVINTTYIVLN